MSPLDRLAVCVGKMLARIEMLFPGLDDDALESNCEAKLTKDSVCGLFGVPPSMVVAETALVDAEAESEVHEPQIKHWTADWKRIAQSLGIDERDAEWVSSVGTHWRWDDGRWYRRDLGAAEWIRAPYDYWPRASGPFTAVDPQAATMDWCGWAVPAILEVLAEHQRRFDCNHPRWGDCRCGFKVLDSSDWDEHVTPLIAARIGCDPQRAIEALSHYKPDRVFP